MQETEFSRRLTYLMKERKISGKRIGDAIGKTQKSISRYANGEVDPDSETKNNIFKAISDISGIPEDGKTIEELDNERFIIEFDGNEFVDYECEFGKQLEEDRDDFIERQVKIFDSLSIDAKKYFLKYMWKFQMIEDWEYAALDLYRGLDKKKQQKFMDMLERHDLELGRMKNHSKLAAYIEMIEAAKNRPVNLTSKGGSQSKSEEEIRQKWLENICKIADDPELFNVIPFTVDLLRYSPEDWYFLLRLNIFESYEDEGAELYEYEHNYEQISMGGNLYTVLEAIKEGRF